MENEETLLIYGAFVAVETVLSLHLFTVSARRLEHQVKLVLKCCEYEVDVSVGN